MEYYILNVLGLERKLPVLPAPNGDMIAGFNPVGDMQLLKAAGVDLVRQIKKGGNKCDIILTTELKGVPIAQEVANLMGVDYVCLRKEKKCYMANPRQIDGESITSGRVNYFISEDDEQKLLGKNVVFVDDVFSTGKTLRSIFHYAKRAGFTVTCSANILKEGEKIIEDKIETGFIFGDIPNYFCGFVPLQ